MAKHRERIFKEVESIKNTEWYKDLYRDNGSVDNEIGKMLSPKTDTIRQRERI